MQYKNKHLLFYAIFVLLLVFAGCIEYSFNVSTGEETAKDNADKIPITDRIEEKQPVEKTSPEEETTSYQNEEMKNEEESFKAFSPQIGDLSIYILKKYEKENKNIIFSPYNIYEVTGMLYYASDGKTKEQFESILGYEDSFKYFVKAKESSFSSSDYELVMANGLWVDKDFLLKESFKNEIENYFSSIVEKVDFSDNENARNLINTWVEENTNGRIKNLFPIGSIPSSTKVVLAGTIYFNGNWEKPFTEKEVKDIKFFTPYKERFVKMLTRKSYYDYYENDFFESIRIPYKGDEISLIIVLPKEKGESYMMEETLKFLESKGLKEVLNNFEEKGVKLAFPKFKFSFPQDLKTLFIEKGLDIPFRGSPDFSRMSDTGISITSAVHKAYIDVNEKGTEASAATGFVGTTSIVEVKIEKEFIADHPFLFFIVDKEGTILFAGKVVDPQY